MRSEAVSPIVRDVLDRVGAGRGASHGGLDHGRPPSAHGGAGSRLWGGALEPFARDGLARRAWPFAAVLALGVALAAGEDVQDPVAFGVALGLAVVVCAIALALPWSRLPRSVQVVLPLACFVVVALLTKAGGGASSGYAPLVIVPVFWLALYGTGRELAMALVGVALTFAVPLVLVGPPEYPAGEWMRMVLWILAAGLVGGTVQRLVRTVRERADTGEALTTAMLESALDCVVAMDHDGRVLEFNPAAERTFGYAREEAIGAELGELIVPESLREAHRRGLARYLATRKASILDRRMELTAVRANGSELPVELTITRIAGVEPPRFTGYIRDLTERRRGERERAAQHGVAQVLAEAATIDEAVPRLLQALAESMDWELGAAWLVDGDAGGLRCRALWRSESIEASEFRELSGRLVIRRGVGPLGRVWSSGRPSSSEDAVQEPGYPRAEAAAREGLHGALWLPIGGGGAEVFGVIEFYSRDPNRLDEALLRTLATIGSQIGEYFRRRRAEERLAHQALHDHLTDLPNRTLLLDRLGQALERSKRRGSAVAVLYMDIDDFKLINDSLGHHVGDELLVQFAARMRAALRTGDTVGRAQGETVARFGGDEFVVLCEDIANEADVLGIADRLGRELAQPTIVGDHELTVTVSIGVAFAAGGDATPDALIRDADAALYRAKERGRARHELFDEAMRTRVRQRVGTEAALRRAIEGGELRLHYQPIVAVDDGAIHGVEALVRWEHPDRGLVSPAEFIPLAEESGLIVPLGRRVIEDACRQAARWQRSHADRAGLSVSVNLSTRQLADRELVPTVSRILRSTALPPGCLTLEITESLLMQDVESSIDILRALKALGVRLSLDDFGTGYSSLGHLKRFPLDILKLDRSFVSSLSDDSDAPAIIAAVIEMARALRMQVIAEGVETEAQLATLRSLGCDLAQGYHFARPLAAEAVTDLLQRALHHG